MNIDICNIYIMSNSINNKVYIGQTWSPINERFDGHKKPSSCKKLFRALNKHGKENFKIQLIVSCDNQNIADYLESVDGKRVWMEK